MSGQWYTAVDMWQTLGRTDGRALVDARVQAHWAAQVVAAIADARLAARDDDGHTAMTWRDGALLGESLPDGARTGLRLADLALIAVGDTARASFPLAGRTLADGLAWAAQQWPGPPARVRDYAMPADAVGRGAAFTADAGALAELRDWYACGAAVLGEALAGEPAATALRCWPHHFDLGAIVFVDPAARASNSPQVGVGLSPGDGHIAEPYFYVTAYPMPAEPELPALAGGGTWFRDGFTGAVLTARHLAEVDGEAARFERARAFLASAIAAARGLVR